MGLISNCRDCDKKLILCLLEQLKEEGYFGAGAEVDLSNYYTEAQVDEIIATLQESVDAALQGAVLTGESYNDPEWLAHLSWTKITDKPFLYLEVPFSSLTDQTFSHTAGRYVSSTVIVNGEEVETEVSYPSMNQIRIRSISPITGILILQ